MSERRLEIAVCRGCCCGTARKHPDVDHDAQVEALRAAVATWPGSRVRTTECLDACDRSNVVVVRELGGRGARRTVWLGGVLSAADTEALCAHVRIRGSLASLSGALAAAAFDPPSASE
jgi:predicted metal-binding protein